MLLLHTPSHPSQKVEVQRRSSDEGRESTASWFPHMLDLYGSEETTTDNSLQEKDRQEFPFSQSMSTTTAVPIECPSVVSLSAILEVY